MCRPLAGCLRRSRLQNRTTDFHTTGSLVCPRCLCARIRSHPEQRAAQKEMHAQTTNEAKKNAQLRRGRKDTPYHHHCDGRPARLITRDMRALGARKQTPPYTFVYATPPSTNARNVAGRRRRRRLRLNGFAQDLLCFCCLLLSSVSARKRKRRQIRAV